MTYFTDNALGNKQLLITNDDLVHWCKWAYPEGWSNILTDSSIVIFSWGPISCNIKRVTNFLCRFWSMEVVAAWRSQHQFFETLMGSGNHKGIVCNSALFGIDKNLENHFVQSPPSSEIAVMSWTWICQWIVRVGTSTFGPYKILHYFNGLAFFVRWLSWKYTSGPSQSKDTLLLV